LHTTFDYAALTEAANIATPVLSPSLYAGPLEVEVLTSADTATRASIMPMIYIAALIMALPILLRVIVSNSDFQKLNLLVTIVVAALLLMSAYFIVQPTQTASTDTQEEPQ
jgi:hypothetical protein